jgi:hypothetical protein
VQTVTYRGWSNSYYLRNPVVEAVVVPSIGRVMQFGFIGQEGLFWQNEELYRKPLSCESEDWLNFGGDKTWPAPEGDWSRFTGKNKWHPPRAFDCMPLEANVEGADLVLTSPVDPHYGIRTTRRIHLDPSQPVMTIATTYERVSGEPAPIGIWVITQLKDPVAVYVPLPADASAGFVLLTKERPPSLRRLPNGILSLKRSPTAAYKIGTQSETLLWMNAPYALRIDTTRPTNREYPDFGSSTEVYTNPNPLAYVELETLGPLELLKAGDKISQTNRYSLFRRGVGSADDEARRILER